MAMPYERQYAISACFLYQQCLYYESNPSITTCQCDLNKKPTLKTQEEKRKIFTPEFIIHKQNILFITNSNLKN